MVQRTYCLKNFFARPPTQFELQTFDDELCSPTTISPLQVGPPTRRELATGHPSSLIEKRRYAPTPFSCAVYIKKTDLSNRLNSSNPSISSSPKFITRASTHRPTLRRTSQCEH